MQVITKIIMYEDLKESSKYIFKLKRAEFTNNLGLYLEGKATTSYKQLFDEAERIIESFFKQNYDKKIINEGFFLEDVNKLMFGEVQIFKFKRKLIY